MSMHLVECVGALDDLLPAQKLALVAFADSADSASRIGLPGLEGVMRWACVSRSRAFEIIDQLVELGYLSKHRPGHRGRRAEYLVFPRGCCDAHPVPIDPPDDDPTQHPALGVDLAAIAAQLGVDVTPELAAAVEAHTHPEGSGGPDSTSGKGSGRPDPFTSDHPGTPERVRPTGPFSEKGSRKGPAHRTPSLTTTTTPPTPHASGAGGASSTATEPPAGCDRHPNLDGDITGRCRRCRATLDQRAAAAAAHRQAARLDAAKAATAAAKAAAVDSTDDRVRKLLNQTRTQLGKTG